MPSLVSVKPKTVSAAASAMSATAQRPIPPPSAAPCTRATTGTGQASIVSSISAMRRASASLSSTDSAAEARIQATSAPAQKAAPSPASTTARSASGGSVARVLKASCRSAISSALKALRTSGRVERDPRHGALAADNDRAAHRRPRR